MSITVLHRRYEYFRWGYYVVYCSVRSLHFLAPPVAFRENMLYTTSSIPGRLSRISLVAARDRCLTPLILTHFSVKVRTLPLQLPNRIGNLSRLPFLLRFLARLTG